jgi:NAD(P)-dependent dehydrogenase (short-subunit alcohol dehydrogenase family)
LTGELICLKFAEEGCNVAVNYNSNAERAKGIADKIWKEHGMKAFIVQGVSNSWSHFSQDSTSSSPA